MSRYQDLAIPFKTEGNRQFLTCLQLAQEPWLLEFRNQFDNCFEYDPYRDVHWFYPGERDA